MRYIPFMPANPQLARAYVPFQMNHITYNLAEGYHKGTLYPDLYSPYDAMLLPDERVCCEYE